MRLALTVLLLVMLAGCATQPSRQTTAPAAPPSDPSYADVRADVLADLAADPRISVSYYALGPCKTWQTWVPKRGAITAAEFWRAIRAERKQKRACRDRHNALREQVKAVFGVFRGYE